MSKKPSFFKTRFGKIALSWLAVSITGTAFLLISRRLLYDQRVDLMLSKKRINDAKALDKANAIIASKAN